MALAVQCPLPLCYNKQLEAMAVKEAAQVVPSLWPHLSQILIQCPFMYHADGCHGREGGGPVRPQWHDGQPHLCPPNLVTLSLYPADGSPGW